MNVKKYLVLCAAVICLCAGCSRSGADYLEQAADAYRAGDYINAEADFLSAIRLGKDSAASWVGYGFNELKAKDFDMAKAVFEKCLELEETDKKFYSDEPANVKSTGEAIRKGLYEACLALQDYKGAVAMLRELGNFIEDKDTAATYKAEAASLAWKVRDKEDFGFNTDEVIEIINDSISSGNETVKSYRMRANLYYLKEDWKNWEQDERNIIAMKDYAFDEYCAIYDVRNRHGSSLEVLELTDEIFVYMLGHVSYIDSYDRLIAMAMKAAELSEYTEYDNNSDYYFDMAQNYIETAQEKLMNESQVLKYQIIMSERKGKYELAYKLLGVYLEHCPDDRMAVKEKTYLKYRVGITEGE